MDATLIQKWLEEGERIEARHLDILKKNEANEGLTDSSDFFRALYYRFPELDDAKVAEAIKVISSFQRGKSSGDAGREVVKDFLANSLTLLSTAESRAELKKYLDKNGLMPEDNSEELRLQEERRKEQERRRREQEEERQRREQEEEQRRRQAEEQHRREEEQRRREGERRERDEERQRRNEEARQQAEHFEQEIDRLTTEREEFVATQMGKRRYNIPWKRLGKVLLIMAALYLLFLAINSIKSCVSSKISSDESASVITLSDESQGDDSVNEPVQSEIMEDDQDYGSPEDGLYGSLAEGTTEYAGEMGGYPIELTITKGGDYAISATYHNVNYGTTMHLNGESLPAQAGDISFFGEENGRSWSFSLTGDASKITGTAYGDDKEFSVTLYPKDAISSTEDIDIVSYQPSSAARNCKLLKVVATSSETRILGVYHAQEYMSIWWTESAYITVDGQEHLELRATEGIPMGPDRKHLNAGEEVEFVLIFPPLPAGTTQFDFFETDDWTFTDIKLSRAI